MKKLSVLVILVLLLQAVLVTPALATGGQYIDLAIIKVDNPDPVTAGNNLTYAIHIANHGSSTASDVYVFDMYPTNSLAVQSTTPSQGTVGQTLPGWVMDTLEQELGITSTPPGFSYLTWQAGDLAAGASADLEIVATVNPDLPLPDGSPIINRALVMSNFDELFWFNNYAITFTWVSPAALPDIEVDPTGIDFGEVQVGSSSAPLPVTVTNTGNADLEIGAVTFTNSAFSIYDGDVTGMTLLPGASQIMNLVFTPSSAGAETGTMQISSNDSDENPTTVSLSGNGIYIITPTPTTTTTPNEVPTQTQGDLESTTSETFTFTVDFLGEITTEPASSDGRPINDVDAYSPDGAHLLEIGAGTRAADSGNNSITTITIREATAPQLPENTALVGSALEFQPNGTSFDHPLTLTLGYNVEDLPENVLSVGTAFYEPGSGWKYLESTSSNSVAEAGKLTSTVSHFTVFAVLAQVPSETHITNQPDAPVPVPDMFLPASFVLSNLSIATSESKTWQGFTYVTRTGEDAHITVDVTNNGEQGGTYQAVLMLNGEPVDSTQFDIGAGETKSISFDVNGNEPGAYTVQIGDQYGEFTSNIQVNWWLIAGSGLFVVVLLGGLLYFVFIRDRNVIKLT